MEVQDPTADTGLRRRIETGASASGNFGAAPVALVTRATLPAASEAPADVKIGGLSDLNAWSLLTANWRTPHAVERPGRERPARGPRPTYQNLFNLDDTPSRERRCDLSPGRWTFALVLLSTTSPTD